MNKHILRTSLVWIVILAVVAGIWAYRIHHAKQPMARNVPMSEDVQPVASGPTAGANEPAPSMPEQKMETPLVPVQTYTRADAKHWGADGHCRIQAEER